MSGGGLSNQWCHRRRAGTHRTMNRFSVAWLTSLLLACSDPPSSADPSPAEPDAGRIDEVAPPDAGDAGAEPAPVRSEECVARDERMAASLAELRGSRKLGLAVQVIDDACGESFSMSGPEPIAPHALVRIGSNTKTYVAVVILGLVADGALGLDDRLDLHLSHVHAAFGSVTVRMLLQHTSGIYNYTSAPAFAAALNEDPQRVWQPEELVALAAEEPLTAEPGARFAYTNTGYVLLGMLAEAVGGASIAEQIRARILTPHQLTETFFDGAEPVVGELAPGRDRAGRDMTRAYHPSWAWTAGAMVSSLPDLARFFRLLAAGALLSPAMQVELRVGVPTEQAGLSYGLGIFDATPKVTGVGDAIGHGGDLPGYHSSSFHFIEENVTIVGIANGDRLTGNDVMVRALEVVFP